ncbi:MAG: trigger factor [Candidatus Melainabacteria bacterium 35_41]|jgi:trigger factor|nr:MAG: trigger factor [Candidatus Melainabacteria bacterium 35_41]CDE88427.1 trigger factor [Clostridium sp. CAG:729]
MKVTLEKEQENVVKLDITIPAKDAVDAYNKAVQRISQYVNIDGFRKGKAPRAVVERHVGTERIKQEAIENLMPKAINQAVVDNNLDIIAQPYITNYNFNMGEDLTVTAKAELRPEVTLGDYKGLNLTVKDTPVDESAMQKSIDNLLSQHSTQEIVTDRPTKETDIAVIDFDGYANGEKIQGGEAKNYPLDLANSNFIPGFAEQLVGKNLNDEFEIKVTFPEQYHDEKLKGQPATFKIKINEIKEKKLPELNDEFAQKVGPFKTVDDLKADIQKYLDTQRERANRQNSENEVFKAVIDAAKVEIPQSMVDREVASLKEEYKQRLAAQGISWDTLVKAQGEDELVKNLKDDALIRIKNSLVIDKIAKTENIKLDQKDLEKKFGELSAAYGMKPQDLIKQLGQNPEVLASISQQAMNDKVRDFLMENNKVEVK